MSNKPMKFNEYMRQYAADVEMIKPNRQQFGIQAEDFIRSALSSVDSIRITKTTPAFDRCYGADFKVQQAYNGKAASLYVDVKLDVKFETGISYLHHTGVFVDDAKQASKFPFSFGTVYFAVKNRQHAFFKYDKPVVVMYISGFRFDMKQDEMNTLALVLSSINQMLIHQGYPYRVSQYVIPNYRLLDK